MLVHLKVPYYRNLTLSSNDTYFDMLDVTRNEAKVLNKSISKESVLDTIWNQLGYCFVFKN